MNILITNISAFSYKKELNTYEIRIDGHISDTIEAYHTNESIIRCLGKLKQVRETGGINKIIALTSSKVLEEQKDNYENLTAYNYIKNVSSEVFGSDVDFISIEIEKRLEENANYEERPIHEILDAICNEINNEDKVYIDAAGGQRTIANVIQLLAKILKYKGIDSPLTLYSNFQNSEKFITDTKNFDKMTSLADAFNEFMTSGKSKLLKELMIDNEEKIYAELTAKMSEFSDKISLGQVDDLESTLKQLQITLENCKQNRPDNIESVVISQFIPTIEEKFFGNSGAEIDYYKITKWCLDNDLIQQALTLFVEKIPICLFAKSIIKYNGNIDEAKKLHSEFKNKNPLWSADWETKSLYTDILCNTLSNDDEKEIEELKLCLNGNTLNSKNAKVQTVLNEINEYFSHNKKNSVSSKIDKWTEMHKWTNIDKAKNTIKNNKRYLAQLLGAEFSDNNKQQDSLDKKFMTVSKIAQNKILKQGDFWLSEDIIPILYGYLYVKSVRNTVNHASSEEKLNENHKKILETYGFIFNERDLQSVKTNVQKALSFIDQAEACKKKFKTKLSSDKTNKEIIDKSKKIETPKIKTEIPQLQIKVVGKIDLELLNKYKKKNIMRKIHITLVGGQTAPVYNGIIYTNPDKVVYIYSDGSKTQVEQIENEIKIQSEKRKFDPVDLNDIEKKVLQCKDVFKEDEVSINISSGTKPWAYFFTEIFGKESNVQIFYVDQNNVVWNLTKRGSESIQFNMHTHFRLYGNSIENNYKKFTDYTEADVNALPLIEKIRRFNNSDFNKLLAALDRNSEHKLKNSTLGRFDLPNGSFVEWEKTNKEKMGFVRICLFKRDKYEEVKIESPNAVDLAFNSGWFEYKIAKLLSSWEQCLEICLNCKFPFRQQIDKNEVDIIINTGTKALFVECKTQITNNTDIDKFASVIKGYGGMGSKGLFVTDAKMSDIAKKKCEDHGILTFSLQEEHLGMPTEKALQMLLESELFNINTK